ncbi:MAG: DUF1269 domain-containing protein [Anaerolineales bacterium]|nr:DUF1269 domain-containing protein [Anaerolineales bacterium]
MSSQHLITIVAGSFPGADDAENALKQVQKTKGIDVHDAAYVQRAADNSLHVKDVHHWGWVKGVVAGGLTGALVGLVVPPLGVVLAVGGAAVGGVATAKDHDISPEMLQKLGETLTAGSSAALVAVDPIDAEATEAVFRTEGATTITANFHANTVGELTPDGPESSLIDQAAQYGIEDQARGQLRQRDRETKRPGDREHITDTEISRNHGK